MSTPRKAPWPDVDGRPIYEGDVVYPLHAEPDVRGTIVCSEPTEKSEVRWWVEYSRGIRQSMTMWSGAYDNGIHSVGVRVMESKVPDYRSLPVEKAVAALQEISHEAWRNFQHPVDAAELNRRVVDFLKNISEPAPLTTVDKVTLENNVVSFNITTRDPQLARILARENDQEYQDLVQRIRDHAKDNPDGTYTCSEEESKVIWRHMDPPIVVTLQIDKKTK